MGAAIMYTTTAVIEQELSWMSRNRAGIKLDEAHSAVDEVSKTKFGEFNTVGLVLIAF